MSSAPAAPVPSLVDAAYEQIRARILDNAWPPGHRALEQEVALALGMSRTPVREALVRLQVEGLVEVCHVEQVVGHPTELFSRGLGRTHVESAVDLHAVGAHELAAERAGQGDRQGGLARARRAR